jgi:hypothetical protein
LRLHNFPITLIVAFPYFIEVCTEEAETKWGSQYAVTRRVHVIRLTECSTLHFFLSFFLLQPNILLALCSEIPSLRWQNLLRFWARNKVSYFISVKKLLRFHMLLCFLSARWQGSSPLQEMQCRRGVICNKRDFSGRVDKWRFARCFYIYVGLKTWNPWTSTDRIFPCALWMPCPYYKFGHAAMNLQFIDWISWMRTVVSFLQHQNPTHHKVSACFPLNFTCSANWKRISEIMISIWRHSRRSDETSRAGLGKAHSKQWEEPEKLLWLCEKYILMFKYEHLICLVLLLVTWRN